APKLFLSSLDPGVGKTQTIIKFIDALLSSPFYRDVGVLVCVARLSEVKSLVESIGIPADMLSVKTSDDGVNALGRAELADAQVLITTQQMVEKRVGAGRLADHPLFIFNGNVRTVRIWDETYLPGQTLTVSRDEISDLFRPLRMPFPKLADQLESFFF